MNEEEMTARTIQLMAEILRHVPPANYSHCRKLLMELASIASETGILITQDAYREAAAALTSAPHN